MLAGEAKVLLGFPPNSQPSSDQIKAAYKNKALQTHPDRFPQNHHKSTAENQFKLISEAYTFLLESTGGIRQQEGIHRRGSYSTVVVRSSIPRTYAAGKGKVNRLLIGFPFAFIIMGTIVLGGSRAAMAYKREQEAYPSHNPFLP